MLQMPRIWRLDAEAEYASRAATTEKLTGTISRSVNAISVTLGDTFRLPLTKPQKRSCLTSSSSDIRSRAES
ncbi:hypothetical protein KCP75_03705 [Salmonella enterica subsp. enterica]|nr:hypothetical protein KCP75_03705 [Salmonella enterica subsp. enterica]